MAANKPEQNGQDSPTIRVFLLDDHEIVRRGLADLLDDHPDLEVVGEAGRASEALAAVEACSPDVAVLDVRLEDGDGVEVCRDIRSAYPEVACLMLTSFPDDRGAIDAARAGAAGYVLKRVGTDELVTAVRKVAAGAQLLDSAEVRLRMRRLRQTEEGLVMNLTDQEHRILELIGEGLSNRQIADEMFLAEKTVKNYISTLFVKLGMTRRTQVAALAARLDEREWRHFD